MAKKTIKSLETQLADSKQEVFDLRNELREAKKKLKTDETINPEDLPNLGLGFIRVDKTYYEVRFRFDSKLENSAIESKKSLGPSFPTAQGKARKTFALDVLDKARRN